MKIAEVRHLVLQSQTAKASGHRLVEVPGLRRTQYTHVGIRREHPARQSFLEVCTDEGVWGRCTTTMSAAQAQILRDNVLGEDPPYRERLYQKLHKGARWVYQPPGWFGDFDNCLWDIAGKAANLPVYALVGRVRERFPAYLTGGDMDLEGYLAHIEAGRAVGIGAYKLHSYKGGKADIPLLRAIREAGTAMLIVEQQVGQALQLCDRVAVLAHGAVEWEGPADEAGDVMVGRMFTTGGDR